MKIKTSLFLAVLLIFICCMGAASASEDVNNDTLTTTDDVAIVESVDDAPIQSEDISDNTLEVNNAEEEVLSTSTATVSSWTDLKTYSEKTDADYVITVSSGTYSVGDQITFGNNAKIVGSGNTIFTGGSSSVTPFYGSGKNITFSNLIFRDMTPNMVIQLVDSGNSKIENCIFENIQTSTSGQKSVVYNNGGYMNITNSNFTNCNTTYGVITNHKTPTTALMDVSNCKFEYNNAVYEPGAINNCGILNVTDSVFNYNHANWWAGAIHTHVNAKSVIKKSSFTGNTAGWNGGALYAYATLEVYDSNFTNNNCSTNSGGGAIGASNYYFASTAYNVTVNNCRFVNNNNLNSAGYGGAIATMNGGVLNVNGSTFIHNSARYGQAIAGFNTNNYSNISHGNARLVITNNQFINHTENSYDTVFISGKYYTFNGNTFINSPQTTIYTGSNTYNSINSPIAKSKNELLGISSDDILRYDESHEFYINSSSETSGDGSSWSNALNTLDGFGMYVVMELWYDESGDYNTIYLADGEYSIEDVIGYAKFVGCGDNVIIKDVSITSGEDVTYKPDASATFINLIFEGFTSLDDYDCTFINCTFRSTAIDLYGNRENSNFNSEENIPIFNSEFINCTFSDITANQIINSHKYNLLKISNCNFTNCIVDSIVSTNGNLTKNDGTNDGVIISNIMVSSSNFKGVLKAQKNTNYSVENINGFKPTSNILEDGNYIYVNSTDVKEPTKTTVNITQSDKNVIITLKDEEGNSIANATVAYTINSNDAVNATTGDDGTFVIPNLKGKNVVNVTYVGNDSYVASNCSETFIFQYATNITYEIGENSIIITLKDEEGNPISDATLSYTINGGSSVSNSTDSNGQITISGLTDEGSIYISYEDTELYTASNTTVSYNFTTTETNTTNNTSDNTTDDNSTTVTKVSTVISASKVTATYNVAKNLVITLKDANGNLLDGKTVTVKVGTISKTLTTNSKGQVSVNVAGLVPKTYTATFTFSGDDNYSAKSNTAQVVVKKATPKITAAKKTFKVKTKTKKYTITLKDNKGKVLKKAKVTLKVKGKTYKATTNAKGKATFKITKLTKKGTFKAVVKFAGNKYFKAVSKTVKYITVKK